MTCENEESKNERTAIAKKLGLDALKIDFGCGSFDFLENPKKARLSNALKKQGFAIDPGFAS